MKKLALFFAISALLFSCGGNGQDPTPEGNNDEYITAFSLMVDGDPSKEFNENMEIEVISGAYNYVSTENTISTPYINRAAPFTIPFQDFKEIILSSSKLKEWKFKIRIPKSTEVQTEQNLRLSYFCGSEITSDIIINEEIIISPDELPWSKTITF
ncbi:hypothetical protein [Persicobacter diffluens]|uniref:Lipoprotein n=1 Tax=Persicobacter diffluens TaxID=981 RepID=A0AAN4W3M5_9BACT|nr:hypothetical protein PEDI_52400 [Persicobacter diffluens]